jgi:hypothetical protein
MARSLRVWLGTAGVVIALAGLAPLATADISDVIYHVVVCDDSGVCVGVLPIGYSESYWQPDGTFRWELAADMDIPDLSGTGVVGTLSTEGEGTSITITPAGAGRANPQVNVNFSVIGGITPGTFTITSALVSFPTIYNATGQVNVGMSVTDRLGSTPGASLTNLSPNTAKSFSWVNGLPGAGGASMFRQLFAQNLVIGGGSTSGTDQTAGFEPTGLDVSSISGQIAFSLSARDLASGSSTFIVTPEPASLLMVLALAALRRR